MRSVPAQVGAEIVMGPLGARAISRLRKALRYPNPEYVRAIRGGESVSDLAPHLSACHELEDGRVRIPRGSIEAIRSTLHLLRLKPRWDDRRAYGERLAVQLHDITPRDYQAEGAELLYRSVQGLIVLPCGGGKTYLAIVAIAKCQVSALVVVPTRDLVDQWCEDVQDVLGLRPAIFGAGKHELGPLTIATKDALVHHRELDLSRFGFVVYDECHRVPAQSCLSLLARVPARYRLGVTATPDREDGQSRIVHWSFGALLLEKTVPQLVRAGHLVLPRVEAIDTNFDCSFPSEPSWSDFNALTDALATNVPRTKLIVDIVAREPTQTWLLLSPSRKALCQVLAERVHERTGLPTAFVTSDLARGKRKKLMSDFRHGHLRILCATSLADEGFNVKHLSRVLLALPESSKRNVTQRLGRLMRPWGDPPVVYDLVDRNVDLLKSRWHSRKSVYRKLGLEITECPTLSLFGTTV